MPLATPAAEDADLDTRLRAELERRLARAPAMMHSIDEQGRLIFVSDAWLAKLGYTREEVLGRPPSDFLTPQSRSYAKQVVTPEFFRTGRCENVELQVLCKDGRIIDVLLSSVLDDNPLGGGRRSIAVLTDVTAIKQTERALAESEARYRLLAENSTDMIVLITRDGTRLYVSPACVGLTGFTPAEMLAMRTIDMTHPEDTARVAGLISSATGQATLCSRLRRKDGSYVWVEATLKPVAMDGRDDLLIAAVRNVDERLQAERRLQESETRYRFLADNSTDLIMLITRDGRRVYASPACRRLLGYTPEEMLAIRSHEAIHPDDVARVLAVLANGEINSARSDQTARYRIRRKDGSYIWVETTGRAVDIAGQTDLRVVIVRDIEQRMQAEQQLKDSEARYRLLADNSNDMVFQLDSDLVRRYVSPACREILGYPPEEMVGIKPVSMAHPDDAPRLALVLKTLMSGAAERQSIVNRIRHRDGRWVWVEAQLRALKDPETGAPCGVIGSLRDVSARKAVEDELAEANRRLQALADQDSLTGLANRRAFDVALAREHLRARRERRELALIMVDVDRFKAFNDIYGHPAGDECLRWVARAIADTIARPGDLAARYGGEEFAVLLPNTDEAGAAVIAERVNQAVLGLAIPHEANASGLVTVSAGVAALACAEADPEALIDNADRALYRAKDFGRNAVIRASEVAPGIPAISSAVA